MALEQYKEIGFKPDSRARIDECNDIIADYQKQGLTLTLRQLYYQLVTKNVITNEEKSYDNLGKLVSNARLAGLMDWDAIEDRNRQPRMSSEWENIGELVDAACRSYRLPRWRGQDNYVELWVEKEALAGVLDPIRREYHVCMMSNKGYSSTSAMRESALRFAAAERAGVLLYLGDHDPSGEDMVRDIRDRLLLFGQDVEVIKVGLTTKQVKHFKPPPNPAKLSDSRAAAYVAKHGPYSWEVDALPPNILSALIRAALDAVIDRKKYDAVVERERRDAAQLKLAAAKLMSKRAK